MSNYFFVFLMFSFFPSVLLASGSVISSIDVIYNGSITQERDFEVGDQITLRINAIDPNSLPMEYIIRRYRKNSFQQTVSNWNSNNEFTYTFVSQDVTRGFSLVSGVKNNDGQDEDDFFGDYKLGVGFHVAEPTKR